jgi:PKD repeat protein
MRKYIYKSFIGACLAASVIMLNAVSASAQNSGCPGADFETGSFTSQWQGWTGTCCPINTPTLGILMGRHTILPSPQGIDPNTCGGLDISPAFTGGYVCRLGNMQTGAQAERLEYSLTVDASNALFIYRYAVVLQDQGHIPAQQPRFEISVLDSVGNLIDPNCGYYSVTAAANIPGFNTCALATPVRWKDWTTVGINLAPYIGQTIRLQFQTGDCSQSGHYGYAYLDCYCMPMAIQTEFCVGSTQVTLTAPPGFTSYQWSNGDTTQVAVVDSPYVGQQVTVVLSTVQNCLLPITTTLNSTVMTPGFAASTSAPCDLTYTFADTSTIVNGQFAHWAWDFGDVSPIDTNQNATHTYQVPGTYIVWHHTYSVSGCADSVMQVINIPGPPVADFSSDSVCVGGPTSFTDLSQVVADSVTAWAWDFGDTFTDASQNPQHTYATAGSYVVTLIVTSSSGCSDTISHTVIVNALPVILTNGTVSVCLGDSAQLIATGAGPTGQYSWSPPTGLSSTTGDVVMGSPATSTTYTVTGTDANGCSNTATASITVNPLPLVATPPAPAYCVGDSVTVCLTGANSYHWDTQTGIIWANGPDSSCVTINTTTTTTYTIVGSSLEGCTASLTLTVTVNPLPVAIISPDGPLTFCAGEDVILTGMPNAMTSYTWSDNQITQSITVNSNATVTVAVVDSNGCADVSDPVTVTVNPNPVPFITPPDPAVCANNTIVITANGGISWAWSTQQLTQSITVGVGTYTVTVTDANSCTGTASTTVGLNPGITAAVTPAGPIAICTGNPAVLTAVPSGPGYTFQWHDASGPISLATNDTYTANVNGSYSVIITDGNGCTGSSNVVLVTLGNGPTVTIQASPTIGCLLNTIYIGYGPQSITLTAIASSGAVTYQWFNASGPIVGATSSTLQVTTSGPYSVIAYDANGCPSPEPGVLTPAINVIDIRCGHGLKKVLLCHVPEGNPGNPQTLCIAPPAIPPHLELHRYDCLGPCSLYYREDNVIEVDNFYVMPHPNPFNNGFSVSILTSESSPVRVNVLDMLGQVVEVYNNVTEETVMGSALSRGIYFAEVIQGENRQMIQVVKSE